MPVPPSAQPWEWARANDLMQKPGNVVAVVGDASIVNGLAFEGLNNAGTLKRQLLIILNDNGMSISQPQGASANIRTHPRSTRRRSQRLAEKSSAGCPLPGHTVEQVWRQCHGWCEERPLAAKFSKLGIKYFGLLETPRSARPYRHARRDQACPGPVLLHLKTVKGNGYEIASAEPTKFHSHRIPGERCRSKLSKGPASHGPPPMPMP